LALEETGRVRLVKLGIRKEKESEDLIRLMLRVIYQAASAKLKLGPGDVTYFDVATGDAISGNSGDGALSEAIEGGCRVLRQMMQPAAE